MSPESWIEYGTPMIMRINNKKVGVINRLLQVVIFTYIVVWVIIDNTSKELPFYNNV